MYKLFSLRLKSPAPTALGLFHLTRNKLRSTILDWWYATSMIGYEFSVPEDCLKVVSTIFGAQGSLQSNDFQSLAFSVETATPTDTINTAQFIRDGDTIVSAGGTYELGFFTPEKSRNRYLGIWYGKISVQTAVWVANRETPLNDSSGVVRLTNEGLLVLLNRSGSIIWSSNTSAPARNPVAQLLDSGNLVVKEEGDNNMENSLWQSFDYPGNTLIPGSKLGRNRITGMDWHLTSWKSSDDPSIGNISITLIPGGYPEYAAVEDSNVKYRAGPWNGLGFSGLPRLKPNPIYTFEFVFNDKEIFYRETLVNNSTHWRAVATQNGDLQLLLWMEQTQSWFLYATVNTDNCERYNLCGPNGICSIDHSPRWVSEAQRFEDAGDKKIMVQQEYC
ncbi:G-type lectin S-receptor-like serine/threonine-protein kinase At4g27290 [Populus alba]|uniref:G-type lectin S-receptor-like serine/threonine-protein kinase At4g27290 n=1 Tax=Populus alba TaxID=43335 RepID=UPI003CC75414